MYLDMCCAFSSGEFLIFESLSSKYLPSSKGWKVSFRNCSLRSIVQDHKLQVSVGFLEARWTRSCTVLPPGLQTVAGSGPQVVECGLGTKELLARIHLDLTSCRRRCGKLSFNSSHAFLRCLKMHKPTLVFSKGVNGWRATQKACFHFAA